MKLRIDSQDLASFLEDDLLRWLGATHTQKNHARKATDASEISEFIEEDVD